MHDFHTKNPYTQQKIKEYSYFSKERLEQCLGAAAGANPVWGITSISERTLLLKRVAQLMEERSETLAQLITDEMGKPIGQSRAELDKCIWVCKFYAKNAASFLADAVIETEAAQSFISYDPLGTILGIMPWNYPFWQVMRFAAPTLTAGNTIILKHAENVSGCAQAIASLFMDAGYPKGCFQVILADHDSVSELIAHDVIKAVSLTGSGKAGRAVAETAGKQLKKAVLELGGNNSCVVWEDADLEKYMDVMVKARMQNNGQSCIAAKRFIVVAPIYDAFVTQLKKRLEALRIGDPNEEDTDISVLARTDLADTLRGQVSESVEMGAKIVMGHTGEGTHYAPTMLTNVTNKMPVFREETFGPVATVIKVANRQEALDLAADSTFGLGTMLFTEDIEAAKKVISQIPDGAFFINEMVKSDVRLPFGGTKNSGYGRELSKEGIMEFVNKKTIYITKN
ncbi:NAD-dependent succinate-semialdehyde dehydrogenase [Maribacter sp. 2-571]|uniref:NAD-dependent succinate-semialdehyde dehydrogenase n=1 Tax=Maribacter sp. 2-571 TaxID=3417569 RepID=UPI003D343AEB